MKSKIIRYLLIVGACLFIAYAWYRGYIPIADGPYKARLRNALNLTILPSSIAITAAGHESWTDYLLFIEISLKPQQLSDLLRGREFVRQELRRLDEVTETNYIEGYVGFTVAERWLWQDPFTASEHGTFGRFCEVSINATHDRVFIEYVVD
jgi:hypothetical protein